MGQRDCTQQSEKRKSTWNNPHVRMSQSKKVILSRRWWVFTVICLIAFDFYLNLNLNLNFNTFSNLIKFSHYKKMKGIYGFSQPVIQWNNSRPPRPRQIGIWRYRGSPTKLIEMITWKFSNSLTPPRSATTNYQRKINFPVLLL